jgi:glycosyltransferase involved in cell wall biosynthesis
VRSLRLLVVVQRYGETFSGGAESHARLVAEGLAARGHHVEVATTRAKSYADWKNHFDEGTEDVNGVAVHRFSVDRPRDEVLFSELSQRVMIERRNPPPLFVQRTWQQLQGPESSDLLRFLDDESGRFDVVLCFTYLYWTSAAGVAIAARHAPTVLQTLAHDEPPFHLPAQDDHILAADRLICSVAEEADLVRRRFGDGVTIGIAGVGTDLDVTGDGARFRAAHGLGDRPYLLYVGRVDPSKGVKELWEQFKAYKERNDNDLALVLLGEVIYDLGTHPDIIQTGFLPDEDRADAIDGCTMVINPSYFESFSMLITEAWAFRRPVLVNARCRVLAKQVERTGGGVAYDGFAELETAIECLVWDPPVLEALGDLGRRYTETHYSWDRVLDRYEVHLHLAASRSRVRTPAGLV